MLVRSVQDLGAVVRQARTERSWTQADLAARVGVARDWVVRLERGHPRLEVKLVLDTLETLGLTLTITDDGDDRAADTTHTWDVMFVDLSEKTDDGD